VFVAAFEPGVPGRAVINFAVLDRARELVGEPIQFAAYAAETRTPRPARCWPPATRVIGDAAAAQFISRGSSGGRSSSSGSAPNGSSPGQAT
jgi:hypothetical protein